MKRETGYYWVKQLGIWQIAEWRKDGDKFYWRLQFQADYLPEYIDNSLINETRIKNPDEKGEKGEKKIQAIVKVDGKITFYLYDKEIENSLASTTRTGLLLNNRPGLSVEVELHSPPLKYNEIKR